MNEPAPDNFGGHIAIRLNGNPVQDLLDRGAYIDFCNSGNQIYDADGELLATLDGASLDVFIGQLRALASIGVVVESNG